MNPAWWLVIWLVSTAVACTLVAWAVYWVGYDHGEREAARPRPVPVAARDC